MKRNHKIHFVADSYSEHGGGHFERLVSLGSDASSAAPRAEFDGNTLYVFIQRRYKPESRISNSLSSVSSSAGSASINLKSKSSPSPSISSSLSKSISSISSSLLSNDDLNLGEEGLEGPLSNNDQRRNSNQEIEERSEPEEEPITTRSTFNPFSKPSKSLTGPQGAKAAAKAAKELANSKAKEAAKILPKLNLNNNPRFNGDYTSNSIGSVTRNLVASLSRSNSNNSQNVVLNEEKKISRPMMPTRSSSFGKATSTLAESSTDSSTSTVTPTRSTSSNSSNSTRASTSLSTNLDSSNPPSSPTSGRPKLRGSNLTLRPTGSTFFEAALGAFTHHSHHNSGTTGGGNGIHSRNSSRNNLKLDDGTSSNHSSTSSDSKSEEGLTPKVERSEFKFSNLLKEGVGRAL